VFKKSFALPKTAEKGSIFSTTFQEANMQNPLLKVVAGENEGEVIEITKNNFIIGRKDYCDWIINSKKISRKHIEIFEKGGYWYAKDLGSHNHSYFNGSYTPLDAKKAVKLSYGDKIQLGKVLLFQFIDPNITQAESSFHQLAKGLSLNKQNKFIIKGREISLSKKEYNLLFLLFEQNGKLVRNEKIVQEIWGDDDEIAYLDRYRNSLDKLSWLLSKKLRQRTPNHEYIGVVKGEGRRFVQKR